VRRELLAGAILALLVRGPWVAPAWKHSLLGRSAIIVGVNVLYERFIDVNGWSTKDVGQRLAGSAGVEVILSVKL